MSDSVSSNTPDKTEKKENNNLNFDVTQLAILVGCSFSRIYGTLSLFTAKIFRCFPARVKPRYSSHINRR